MLSKHDIIEVFDYLDDLRMSGRTNMFGAPQYVVDELCWEKNAAREGVSLWMQTFSEDKTLDERIDEALNK